MLKATRTTKPAWFCGSWSSCVSPREIGWVAFAFLMTTLRLFMSASLPRAHACLTRQSMARAGSQEDAARRRAHLAARERQERLNLRNFSRKRPEITNLNHQYAIRRVFMALIRATKPACTASITPEPACACNVLHNQRAPIVAAGSSRRACFARKHYSRRQGFRFTSLAALAMIARLKSSDNQSKGRRRCREERDI